MKKVVFVIADLGPGGAQRVMAGLANDVARRGEFAVDVISTALPSGESFYAYDSSITIHYAAIPPSDGGIISGVAVNIRRVVVLRALFARLKPDVIVSFLTEINCLSLLAAAGTDVPVVISERSDPYHYPAQRLWRMMRRLVYPRARMLVCQTRRAAGFFPKLPPKTVIYNPIDMPQAPTVAPVAGPYILGVGRHSEEKGFDLLIRAHALALARAPDLRLVLVGEGPDTAKLKALAAALGTADSVVFAGAQKDVAPYYRHALAFVLPSRFEGMPNALLEAMACGCPPIVTPGFAAAPEIIEDGHSGMLLASLMPEEVAGRIVYLYENTNARSLMAENVMKNINQFSPTYIYDRWMDILRGCV